MALRWKTFYCVLAVLQLHLLQTANGQYFTVGEMYYRAFTTQKVNWYRAFQTCSALGMQLASIENESDWTELRNSLFFQSLLGNSYWLAGSNLASKGEYIWLSSGKKFAYTSWAASQPGTAASRCVRTNANFNWVADACNSAHYFICSKPLTGVCGVYGQCSDDLTYLYEY